MVPPSIALKSAYGSYLGHDESVVICIVFSIIFGIAARQLHCSKTRENTIAFLGFICLLVTTGYESVFIIFHIGLTLFLIKKTNALKVPQSIFLSVFACRIFFYLQYRLGFSSINLEYTCTNAIHLTLVIKMITVAYEIRDYRVFVTNGKVVKERKGRELGRQWPLEREPTSREIVCYFLNFPTLLAGPLITFRTHYDCFYSGTVNLPYKKLFVKKLAIALLSIIPWQFFKHYFPIQLMREDEFFSEKYSNWYRVPYATGMSINLLWSFGVAWLLTEVACVANGLGLYPSHLKPKPGQGPSVQYSQEKIMIENVHEEDVSSNTVQNIDPLPTMFSASSREFFRQWNTCIQWWLGNFVYHSDALQSFPRIVRAYAVMIVSAVWHGYQLGYHFSFLSIPLLFVAEDSLVHIRNNRIKTDWKRYIFTFFMYILKMLSVGYTMVAVKIRTYDEVLRYYRETYYIMHIANFAIVILCTCFNLFYQPSENIYKKNK